MENGSTSVILKAERVKCLFFSLRHCLVREKKIFRYHIGRLIGCQKGFSDTDEKN